MNKLKRLRAAGLAVILGGLGLMLGTVAAQATAPPDHKVTICHATGSATNPFTRNEVDIASAGYDQAGHSKHADDIIQPYTYRDFSYPGMNWDADHIAIWRNGCVAPAAAVPTPTPTPTAAPTPSPSQPPASTPTPTPSAAPTATPSSAPSASPSAPSAGVNPSAGATPSPSGAVLGEALAATGSNNPLLELGLFLVLIGLIAIAATAVTARRRA